MSKKNQKLPNIHIEQTASMKVQHTVEYDYLIPPEQCVIPHHINIYIDDESKPEGRTKIGFLNITEYKHYDLEQAGGSFEEAVLNNGRANPNIHIIANLDPEDFDMMDVPPPFDMVAHTVYNIDMAYIEADYRGHGYGATAIDAALHLLGNQTDMATFQPMGLEDYSADEVLRLHDNLTTVKDPAIDNKIMASMESIGFAGIEKFGGVMVRNCCMVFHMAD